MVKQTKTNGSIVVDLAY